MITSFSKALTPFIFKSALVGALISASSNVLAVDLLIQNARIIGGDDSQTSQLKDILIKGQRISAIASDIEVASDVRVIDANGRPISSGFLTPIRS